MHIDSTAKYMPAGRLHYKVSQFLMLNFDIKGLGYRKPQVEHWPINRGVE